MNKDLEIIELKLLLLDSLHILHSEFPLYIKISQIFGYPGSLPVHIIENLKQELLAQKEEILKSNEEQKREEPWRVTFREILLELIQEKEKEKSTEEPTELQKAQIQEIIRQGETLLGYKINSKDKLEKEMHSIFTKNSSSKKESIVDDFIEDKKSDHWQQLQKQPEANLEVDEYMKTDTAEAHFKYYDDEINKLRKYFDNKIDIKIAELQEEIKFREEIDLVNSVTELEIKLNQIDHEALKDDIYKIKAHLDQLETRWDYFNVNELDADIKLLERELDKKLEELKKDQETDINQIKAAIVEFNKMVDLFMTDLRTRGKI